MDHAPIYRAAEQHPPTPRAPVRRSMSLASAVAALTIGGIALGYHGFARPGLDAAPPSAQTRNASIGVPVPIVALPLVNGGHPDLLAQLSRALVAPVEQVRAIVQPVSVAQPPAQPAATPSVFLPEPLPAPFVLSVDIAAPEDAAPADDLGSDASASSATDEAPAPAATGARLAAPVRFSAPVVSDDDAAATAPEVDAASVDEAPPAPEPAPPPPAAPAPVKAAAPAPIAVKAAAPAVVPQAAPPPPPPAPVLEAHEAAPPRVAIVHEDPKPQPRQDDAPKPEAKKDPGPPPQQAQAADHGDGGHADNGAKNNNSNSGGSKGDNGNGNKGGGKGKG